MSDLVPKKERNLGYWLQGVTILISLLAVIASIFAGWMAYNASISAAEVSGKMNKENELETRYYSQKYELYKEVANKLKDIYSSNSKQEDPYIQAQNILTYLKVQGPLMRIIGAKNVIFHYNCLAMNLMKYVSYGPDEEIKKNHNNDKGWIDLEAWVSYDLNIPPAIYLLENSMRIDLIGEEMPNFGTKGVDGIWLMDKKYINSICEDIDSFISSEMYFFN